MTALLSIGELATQTGLPVRTIRFYSDAGVVPEAERSEAGYRLYGPDALARLGLVRTLRDLGVDLPTIRRVLEREVSVADVAAAHAAAIDAQIRVLRVQKAVLGAVARRGSDPKEMQRMHKLAQLSDDERKRIVAEFLEEAFDGLDMEPGFAARMRSAAPELPTTRRPSRSTPGSSSPSSSRTPRSRPRSGACPSSTRRRAPAASRWSRSRTGRPRRRWSPNGGCRTGGGHRPGLARGGRGPRRDPAGVRRRGRRPRRLADRFATGTDARAERYWQLLAIINGWPPVPTTVPAWEWLIAALRA